MPENHMTLNQLRAFAEAERLGSSTAAAVAAGRIEAGLVILSIDAARGDGPEVEANIY
ncbi:hypothetical protein ACGFZL_10620 [Streptomyces sp. NPDC048182]|uniref:hypothetical protein n=1 Tax=Streptomyces sp. NPDC048182 TaxID=3365507 RepID=UPI0037181AD2